LFSFNMARADYILTFIFNSSVASLTLVSLIVTGLHVSE
jgi:hypothetical protein